MRALLSSTVLAFACVCATGMHVGCKNEHQTPDWMKPPASYQPADDAKLTFNKSGLEKFNSLDAAEQEAFVEQLKQKPGTFVGQAIVKAGTGVSEHVEEHQFGSWEITASTDPVLYEITIDYALYTTPEQGRGIARNRAIEFRGTVIGVEFQNKNMPRNLTVRVKVDDVKALE